MYGVNSGIARGWRGAVCGLGIVVLALAVGLDDADARSRRKRVSIRSTYSPPYASIVVDANAGRVLQETNADSLRHPASLTKIMTLYLLFERLEAGKIRLGTVMTTSGHAAAQSPTKLGLKPGSGIKVEDAIRGLVTRSANDAAVVIAETLGGDEETFAELMTKKARALGMARTVYRNASGLPDDEQVTTARDQATLGRAIQERFPRYYTYFATPSFSYNGRTIRNHNRLIGRIEGVDGIKTGYTHASGFNLVTSLRRGGKHLVAVVLGGRSAGARDTRMRELIGSRLAAASTKRTAPMIAEASAPAETRPARPTARLALAASGAPAPVPTGSIQAPAAQHGSAPVSADQGQGSADPIKPIAVRTIRVKLGNARPPANVPSIPSAADEVRPPQSVAAAPPPPVINPQPGVLGVLPASAVERNAVPVRVAAASAGRTEAPSDHMAGTRTEAKPDAKAESRSDAKANNPPAVQHNGWIIQVGAFPAEGEAKERLSSARSKAKSLLARADAFTEAVTKGEKTLYRARFAGLGKEQAEAACKYLKRNEMACLTIKN